MAWELPKHSIHHLPPPRMYLTEQWSGKQSQDLNPDIPTQDPSNTGSISTAVPKACPLPLIKWFILSDFLISCKRLFCLIIFSLYSWCIKHNWSFSLINISSSLDKLFNHSLDVSTFKTSCYLWPILVLFFSLVKFSFSSFPAVLTKHSIEMLGGTPVFVLS